jgi:phospholipid-transporting ATPase
MPLSFVVSLNGLKDIFEDYKRKKSDKKENQSECYIYNKSNGFEKKKWLDIKLGDIVKVNNNQQFPADLLLLSTSDENGICYIETKNLDGETNLKFRQANKTLHDSIYKNSDNQEYLSNLKYVCITKPPNEFIYKFDATLYETENDGSIVDRNKFELFSNKSFLLRGCSLRQTEYVIGVAIYIGPHTKSMINSPDLKSKHSSVEVEMNKQLIAIFVIQLFIALFTSIIYSVIYGKKFFGLKDFYFLKPKTKKAYKGGVLELMYKIGGTWILICTNFVPISLLVTMESIKFFQGMFMEWDIDMYDKESLSGCKVQSSTLNEELGQVKYVFSDKTGTLTKNYMKYKMMSIGDKIYGTFINELNSQNNNHEIANQNSDNSTSDNDTDNDNENLNVKNDNNIINEDNENKKKEFVVKDKYGDIPNVEFVDKNNSLKEDMNNEDKKELINEFMLCL